MPTLEEFNGYLDILRRDNPGVPDDILGGALIRRYGEPDTTPAAEPASEPWEITKGFSAGVDQLKALGGGLVGMAGSALNQMGIPGGEDIRNWGLDVYQENMDEAALSAPAVSRIEDIDGVGSFADWAMYQIGNLTPTMALMFGTGGAGGLVAKKAAQAGIEKAMASAAVKEMTQAQAQRIAQKEFLGQALGAYAGSAGMEAGSIYGDIVDQTGQDRPGVALGFGLAAGALDALPIMRVFSKAGVAKEAKSEILREVASNPMWAAITKEVVKQGSAEGITEAGQTILERAAINWVDKNKEIFDEKGLSEIMNAAAAGALMGGVMGPVTGVAEKRQADRFVADEARQKIGDQLRKQAEEQLARDQRLRQAEVDVRIAEHDQTLREQGIQGRIFNSMENAPQPAMIGAEIAQSNSVTEALAKAERIYEEQRLNRIGQLRELMNTVAAGKVVEAQRAELTRMEEAAGREKESAFAQWEARNKAEQERLRNAAYESRSATEKTPEPRMPSDQDVDVDRETSPITPRFLATKVRGKTGELEASLRARREAAQEKADKQAFDKKMEEATGPAPANTAMRDKLRAELARKEEADRATRKEVVEQMELNLDRVDAAEEARAKLDAATGYQEIQQAEMDNLNAMIELNAKERQEFTKRIEAEQAVTEDGEMQVGKRDRATGNYEVTYKGQTLKIFRDTPESSGGLGWYWTLAPESVEVPVWDTSDRLGSTKAEALEALKEHWDKYSEWARKKQDKDKQRQAPAAEEAAPQPKPKTQTRKDRMKAEVEQLEGMKQPTLSDAAKELQRRYRARRMEGAPEDVVQKLRADFINKVVEENPTLRDVRDAARTYLDGAPLKYLQSKNEEAAAPTQAEIAEEADTIRQAVPTSDAFRSTMRALEDKHTSTKTKIDLVVTPEKWRVVTRNLSNGRVNRTIAEGFFNNKDAAASLGRRQIVAQREVVSHFSEETGIGAPDTRVEMEAATKAIETRFRQEDLDSNTSSKWKSREKMVSMPIDDFLSLAAPGEDPIKAARVKKMIENGEAFEIPTLSFINQGNGLAKVEGHEGRHRARELKKLGYTHIPVILQSHEGGAGAIRWANQDSTASFDYVRDYPNRLEAQESTDSIDFPVRQDRADEDYQDRNNSSVDAPTTAEVQSEMWDNLLHNARNSDPLLHGELSGLGATAQDLSSQEFWDGLASRNLSQFERVASALTAYTDEVLNKMEGGDTPVSRAYRRVQAATSGAMNKHQPRLALLRPLNQITIEQDYLIEEDGEIVTVERNAADVLREADERVEMIQRLQGCLKA